MKKELKIKIKLLKDLKQLLCGSFTASIVPVFSLSVMFLVVHFPLTFRPPSLVAAPAPPPIDFSSAVSWERHEPPSMKSPRGSDLFACNSS